MVRFMNKQETGPAAPKMQVLGLGLSRCATSSFQAAVESDVINLGPSMHMAHVAPYADRLQMVIDAIDLPQGSHERQKILHKLFDGYGAACDFPTWYFSADLMDMYPDAAIVLNQRQSARIWADSIQASIGFFRTLPFLVTCYLWKTDRLHYHIHHICGRKLTIDLFSPEFYDAHNDWVRAEAAKRGRPVLEWQAGDGWGPLCEFLGKGLPTDGRPFPHLNDAADMTMLKRILVARGLISWAILGLAGFGAYYYLWPRINL